MDTIKPIQVELKRIGDKVDGRSTSTPPPKVTRPSLPRASLPPARSTPPALSPPSQRVDDDVQEVSAPLGADSDFPPLAPSGNRRTCYKRKVAGMLESWNALIPGAPAPGQLNPSSGFTRAPPIFASVVTKEAMGAQINASDKAKTARDIQRRNPSGKVKPGHSTAPLGFTEVVVTRNGGMDNAEEEEMFLSRF
jgi:hypothetical protein